MFYCSRKFVSIRLASLANFWRICLLLCIAATGSARADDLFWGSTDGSKLVLYDASGIAYGQTGKLYGAVYSPASGSIDSYDASTKKWSKVTSPASLCASSQANMFIRPTNLSTVYFTNGSNRRYPYDLGIGNMLGLGSILGAGGNLQSLAAVPEPSIGVMVGIGFLGLIGFQRWRRGSIAR
jgi:hypothetical protein